VEVIEVMEVFTIFFVYIKTGGEYAETKIEG
jgi:hypothetical protein